ncbi:MAG: NEW3 domain-containing protein, partial [Candidatus Micrarchaeia archaeon]
IYYNYDSSTGSKTGSLTTTIALPVSQRQIVEVKTVSINGTTVTPGDKFTVDLKLINTGGVVKNAVIKSPDNSSFTIDGASQQTIGDIAYNSSKLVSVDLRSSSSSSPGKYTVPLTIEYQDALQNTVSQKVYVGPVSVLDSSAQFDISLKPISDTEVGSQATFSLIVLNRGATAASLIIDFNESSVFIPMGNGRIYIDNIRAGETVSREVIIGIDPSASGGYYSIPVEILSPGKSYVQDVGVKVLATEEITTSIKADVTTINPGSSVTISAQIANTGNTPIRSVYVSAQPTKDISVVGTSDKFIGTLNVDDFTTFQFAIGISGRAQPGNYTIPIKIAFKDSTNAPHEIYKNINIVVSGGAGSSSDFVPAASSSATGISTSFAGRKQNGILGFGTLGDAAGAIILLAMGYFAYKKFWLKRKEGKKENEKAKGIN